MGKKDRPLCKICGKRTNQYTWKTGLCSKCYTSARKARHAAKQGTLSLEIIKGENPGVRMKNGNGETLIEKRVK
ncbi:hypothetical protein [Halobacillus litoralis]|uniref:Uncharacterized protein n=1 Tax=Halobacillus litoralis TaxID=45668 RepID=A0A410MCJ9_9BACI|nr:hypothetical protein [Halobacillus litoralis]QAS52403.1 hypothetical protein HLI_09235 [Halobacillus litoralis]